MKRPSFQFYPKDWLSDVRLRSVSEGARGLWADLMCVMHGCEPYGYLVIEGRPMSDETAARMIGVRLPVYRKHLKELEIAGVSSRTDDRGILFSRRMVKDEAIRQTRAEVGSMGGYAKASKHSSKPVANALANPLAARRQMVAAATADGESDPETDDRKGGPGGNGSKAFWLTASGIVREKIPEEYRGDYDGQLRASHRPEALIAELEKILGHNCPGLEQATPSDVGTALRDLALAGLPLTGGRLRGWVRGAMEGRSQPGTGETDAERIARLQRKFAPEGAR